MNNNLREKFEEWVIDNEGMHLLTLTPLPAVRTDSETEVWMANPYCHPWTAGAYEVWKHLYRYKNGPIG